MSKHTVLLVHSGGFTSRQWRKLSDALAENFFVLAPDLIGYGATAPWPDGEPFHFRQDVAYLESLLDASGEAAHLVGHSYGGFLALQLALRRPDLVRSIAAYEPVAFGILDDVKDADARAELAQVRQEWTRDASGADEGWLRDFVDWWNGTGTWQRLPDETRASMRAVGWKVFQEVISLAADRTDRATYATISAPTLLLGGSKTPDAEQRVLHHLGDALPNATVHVFENVGHMGPISHAALVNGAITEFLNAVSNGG